MDRGSQRALTKIATALVLAAISSSASGAEGAAARTGNPLRTIPLAELHATRERPLFSASRRPPPIAAPEPKASAAVPVATAPAPESPPPLTLVGTVIGAHSHVALLRNSANQIVTRRSEGESESEWRLVAVQPRAAILSRDSQTITLALDSTQLGAGGTSSAAGVVVGALAPPPFSAARLRSKGKF